jgi:hypothetical protein
MLALYITHRELILGVLLALGICGSLIALAMSMRAMHEDELAMREEANNLFKKDDQ